MADDFYQTWYQSKVWQLLPAIYRAQDAAVPDVQGPLQELLNRIGAQFAVLRRSIDRMWENQSIETCDDWVIPYIGDLLATRLVSCLDSRAQRLDVAKTIYYRRRAGTLGLLEELVADIAGRDARAVEFFRRLGRTRHQFDPPIGNAFVADAPAWAPSTSYATGTIVTNGLNAYLCIGAGISGASGGPTGAGASITDGGVVWQFYQPVGALIPAVIAGLAGADSRTPAGGFADLRNTYAAANTGSAFDEYAYTADLRAGAQSFGWYNISHLGLFIWWLQSFPIVGATPVASTATPGVNPCFTFDPSGRQIPLFAPSSRIAASFGNDWVSPDAWQLPVPVTETLWNTYPDPLYPSAFAVLYGGGTAPAPVARQNITVHPETGLFSFTAAPPIGTVLTQYHIGLLGAVGAGGYTLSPPAGLIVQADTPAALTAQVAAMAGDITVQVTNSITYPGLTSPLDIGAHSVVLTAISGQRPVIRWAAGGGNLTINGNGGNLTIQGIWLQGADITLTGNFATITLQYVTLDPGTEGTTPGTLGTAIDGLTLAPSNLVIEASITDLVIANSITGPIVTQAGGAVEQLTATDSIVQAVNTGGKTTDYALSTGLGSVSLARCTILGPSTVHRLNASECILDDVTIAADDQHGCVRFSAIATGSAVHAPYRCVQIIPRGAILRSRNFGNPNYTRLLRLADNAIINPQPGDTILGGAANGSEMGVWQGEGITLIKRGLVPKFEEYAPLGVFPVWIEAD
jgi:hypothetical protein